jgi:NAD(P)H-hydrate repair Nnr-like enzyme with NAD(P)H-hydrate epimerase domain
VTTEQMIEVDRAMMQDFRIELIQMMENAGRTLAHLTRVRFFDGDLREKNVVVLAGTGGNGGGALVCACRLHTWGAHVCIPPCHTALVPRHCRNFWSSASRVSGSVGSCESRRSIAMVCRTCL